MTSVSFKRCIRNKICADPELSKVHSLVLFGSYVRGDFVPELSDLDLLVIFRSEPPDLNCLQEIVEGCVEGVGHKLLDLSWEKLEYLPDPMNMGYGFKFPTMYLQDFLENHEVIYGEEIADLLPRYNMNELVGWRAERLSKLLDGFKDRPDLTPVLAGEVCRLMAIVNGSEDISKRAILDKLKAIGDERAIEIYDSYVKGVKPDKGQDYFTEFIESRIRIIESKSSQRRLHENTGSTS